MPIIVDLPHISIIANKYMLLIIIKLTKINRAILSSKIFIRNNGIFH